jgi:hypothetical protein
VREDFADMPVLQKPVSPTKVASALASMRTRQMSA